MVLFCDSSDYREQMIVMRQILIIVVAVLFGSSLISAHAMVQGLYTTDISGRVVDSEGLPVANALVFVVGKLSLSGRPEAGLVFTMAKSGKDGRFVNHFLDNQRSLDVYVAEPHEDLDDKVGSYLLMFFTKPSPTLHLDLTKRKQDIGDIPVQIRWRPVQIHILNAAQTEAHLSRDNWMNLSVRVKNESGAVVDEVSAFYGDPFHKKYIQLALPVGLWNIEVGIKRKDTFTLWNSIGDPLEVKGGEPLFTGSVIIPDAKQ